MGLSIEVGYLADQLQHDQEGAAFFLEELETVNAFLACMGLPAHVESRNCPVFSADMFSYSGLHYLRRIAAHLDLRGTLPPPGDGNSADDPTLKEYYRLFDDGGASKVSFAGNLQLMFARRPPPRIRNYDHLIIHSDAEGFYLPQDFASVLTPPESAEILGGMIGSSVRLLAETASLAKILELPLDMDPEAEELWQAADTQGEGDLLWQRYGIESYVCLRLHHAARHSITHSAAIVFC